MTRSKLDVVYRNILASKFFTKGWGDPQHLIQIINFRKRASLREVCYNLIPSDYKINLINQEERESYRIIDGKLTTPLAMYLPQVVPEKVVEAYFQLIIPVKWKDEYKPICIHLAGTGDHHFWRRRNLMAKPLLQQGIGALLLENPYYGLRKPVTQLRSSLHYVSDMFVMGGCLILENIALLNWLESLGFGPLGISGISMGGHMASLAATNWPKPLVLVPCLSWSTASTAFTEGVLTKSIDWDLLQKQYLNNDLYCHVISKMCKIVDDPSTSQFLKCYCIKNAIEHDDLRNGNLRTPYDIVNVLQNSRNGKNTASKENHGLMSSKSREKTRDIEAIWFMRGLMDECTHLKNFSVPYDTSLITVVCASLDGYVPRTGVSNLEDLWPGARVKYIRGGHVATCLLNRAIFIKCIVEAFGRAKSKSEPPTPRLLL